jgi:hypothetical protein
MSSLPPGSSGAKAFLAIKDLERFEAGRYITQALETPGRVSNACFPAGALQLRKAGHMASAVLEAKFRYG